MALVQVDTGLAHLDRPFEYTVPSSMAGTAQPGVRVKVRFAGQDLDGFVLERRADAEHLGRLSPLRKVVSPEPVLTPEVLAAARAVADRYAGSLGDVLRLAVPPRHATAEKALARRTARAGRPRGPRSAWRGRRMPPVPPSCPGSPTAVTPPPRCSRCPRRPAATGRCCSRRLPGPPSRAAGVRCSSCPTTATSCASRRRSPRCSVPVGTPGSPPTRDRRRATRHTSRCCGGMRRSSSAPGRRRSPRCTTSGSSRGGTTATTCSRSRARPTPTSGRCCSPGPAQEGAAVLSAGVQPLGRRGRPRGAAAC